MEVTNVIIDLFITWLQTLNAWIEGLIWSIIAWIQMLGPIGVFLGVMIETFIAPIPSPIIMMAAGFILTSPCPSCSPIPVPTALLIIVINVMLVGAFAVTIGSFFGYGIAYFGGYPIIERWGKYLGTSVEEVEYMRQRMERSSRDEIFLFSARAIPIIPLSLVSLLYGVLRADIKRFTIVTFLGALPRCLVLGILGWIVGAFFFQVAEMIDLMETMILVILLIFFIVFIIYRIVIRRKAKQAKQKARPPSESEQEELIS
ncbi:MAG: DedA family protein [Candidatus Hodarchaeota archaeon]